MINTINSYYYISTATVAQVLSQACTLVSVNVNTTSTGTIAIIDGTTGLTATLGQLKASIAEGTYTYNVTMGNGLRINNPGGSNLTIVYRIH